jgi:COMM domain containing 4
MRFRFCGDSDCPDWVLLEISTLSKLPAARIKTLVTQILSNCIRGTYNDEKLLKLAADNTSDGLSDIKGAVAAVHFMVVNAAKYDVDDVSLCTEIQQLGLPKENAEAIARQFSEHKEGLRGIFSSESYRTNRLLNTDWRLDQVIASSRSDTKAGPLVHIKMLIDSQPQASSGAQQQDLRIADGKRVQEEAFEVSVGKLDVLIHELSTARDAVTSVTK